VRIFAKKLTESLENTWGTPRDQELAMITRTPSGADDVAVQVAAELLKDSLVLEGKETTAERREKKRKEIECPECPGILTHEGGCAHCTSCGYERCL